ncbi:chromatin remodeling complex subunit (Chd3), putative [Paecilomyces variotii No. 5]|uniref:Chromatin remodeling complex subunit (Chd3), putative n=1 Tax=Byssochlamys spectabilis (strain No. 5 / NBRC 109023) TaxID=1356009 RepID=V5G407_BYSSN|nr:chromatin remodeling complex subunit (Chd3), putative [Paecilomyces variotii No. 5]
MPGLSDLQNGYEITSGPDDGDELVAELLEQFAVPTATSSKDPSAQRSQRASVDARMSTAPGNKGLGSYFVGIEVPRIHDIDEYEFLPGYDKVRRVLSESNTPWGTYYWVGLRSGDKDLVSSSRLPTLTNGDDALAKFNSSNKHARQRRGDMDSVGRRKALRQNSEGFVSSTNLALSDEEDTNDSERPTDGSLRSIRLIVGPPPPPSEDEYLASSSESGWPTRRLSTRGRPRRVVSESSDEEQEIDDSSSDDLATTFTTRSLRKRKRHSPVVRRSKRQRASGYSESESEYSAPTGTRFSTRTRGQPRKNLRERFESDISENETTSRETKYSGAKEYFEKTPKDNEFRLRHRNVCETCYVSNDDAVKGPLVFCQGCTSAFHKVCLGPRGTREHLVTKVGADHFILQCRRCIGVAHTKDWYAPHQGFCTECKNPGPMSKPLRERLTSRQEQQLREKNWGLDPMTPVDKSLINNVDNVLFRCSDCYRAFHFEHLPPKSEQGPVWEDEEMTPAELADARFKEYSRRWICKDCSSVPGEIAALVAWRPTSLETYVPGTTAEATKEDDKEYLVKWKNMSYFRTEWMPGPWIYGVAAGAMRRAFEKSPKNLKPQMTTEDAIPEEYLRVDIVFDVRYSSVVSNRTLEIDKARVKEVKEAYVKFKGLSYEDAVWESAPDPSDIGRWNDFKSAYEDWILRDYVRVPKPGVLSKHLAKVRSRDFESTLMKRSQPTILTGGQIMDYQKDGLNWLYYMWYKKQNAILADEMGLGKTIQIIGLFATLIQDHKCWPFLVVVPNSTCPNWRREIKTWAPSLRVVTYYGGSVARNLAYKYEMFPEGSSDLRSHIVITSYETLSDDKAFRTVSKIPWAGLVVDEGQRLKNDKNQLYEALSKVHFPFKVLLTGTPLQNNVRELFNLLQFCDPTKNAEVLAEKYANLTKENVAELHDLIRPFFLRRTKAQVLNFLPPMAQIIVPVTMSVVQKKLYKSILAKNPQLIKSIFKNGNKYNLKQNERHSLSNILMQLRKCLCHPFVYSRAIEERTFNAIVAHRNLVEASGKLQLLEIMLPKLHERGHRVLIFSQFLDNLDMVEDFLDGLGLLHRRLDGSMSSLEKQKRIDEYNAPDSPYFAFLLSTRAGGVGINLATADTVIIMDPDFNPHQDIQALSRAHRIGQQKKVLVFQLMTRGSAEEKIMQMGRRKMAMDHVLIEQMDAEDEAGMDIESILSHGAAALFDNDDSGDIRYDSDSVDKLLDRSQAENTQTGEDASAESQFSFARVWANESSALENTLGNPDSATPPNSNVWEKILKERERAAEEEATLKAQAFGRGKRKRNVVDYSVTEAEAALRASPAKSREVESDAEFIHQDDNSETDQAGTETEATPKGKKIQKARPFKRVNPLSAEHATQLNGTALDGSADGGHTPTVPCLACKRLHPTGHCPLKLSGVEHCGLCGIAHFGHQRTCPHLTSESQVALMLSFLKESTEIKSLVEEARRYLRGVRGDLVRRRKDQEQRTQLIGNPLTSAGPPPNLTYNPAPPSTNINGLPHVQQQNATGIQQLRYQPPPTMRQLPTQQPAPYGHLPQIRWSQYVPQPPVCPSSGGPAKK